MEITDAPQASNLLDRRLTKGKARGSFIARFLPTGSPASVTSVEESESSVSHQQEPTRIFSPQPSRRVSVNDVLPTEVEVIYDELTAVDSDGVESNDENLTQKTKYTDRLLLRKSISKLRSTKRATETAEGLNTFLNRVLNSLWKNQANIALMEAEEGLSTVSKSSPMYWRLEALKAEALSRTGSFQESLDLFESILQRSLDDCSASEFVSMYFSCGRLSRLLKQYQKALEYHSQELLYMRAVAGNSLDVARIYQDLAAIAQYGLGDWSLSYVYYEQALHIEAGLWQRLSNASHLKSSAVDEKKRHEALQEAVLRIQETKKRMGRIQFCLGNVSEGLRLSSHRFQID